MINARRLGTGFATMASRSFLTLSVPVGRIVQGGSQSPRSLRDCRDSVAKCSRENSIGYVHFLPVACAGGLDVSGQNLVLLVEQVDVSARFRFSRDAIVLPGSGQGFRRCFH